MKGKYITRNIQLACLTTEKPKPEADQKKVIAVDLEEKANNCTGDNETLGNTWLVFSGSDAS